MARLLPMPPIAIDQAELAAFGARWKPKKSLPKAKPRSSSQLGELFDDAVAKSLAAMLGNIPTRPVSKPILIPTDADCVETRLVRVIGGVRPQNFDVGYRPDGVRFAFDSKTLNDTKSVKKNYQNMINDLATEATTVHTRFPYALVAVMVIIPEPCLLKTQRAALSETLERLGRRRAVDDPAHLAEAAALVLWNPEDGSIDAAIPNASHIRLESFSATVSEIYAERYKGLPPHAKIGDEAENAMDEAGDISAS